MGEFEDKLNSILWDQQAMGQIMALAQSLGKPVLVLRKETERPEAVEAGTVKLAGVEEEVKMCIRDRPETGCGQSWQTWLPQ